MGRPDFCQGSPAGMNKTRSSPTWRRAVSPMCRCPMCIGSNVPPRIPVRTTARIGPGRGDQAQRPAYVGRATSHVTRRIDIPAVHSQGQVDAWPAVGRPREPDHVATVNVLTLLHRDVRKVGDRDLESSKWLDGDGLHAGDGAGKCHLPGARRPNHSLHNRRIVHTPMTAVVTHRRIPGSHLTANRRHEANRTQDQTRHRLPLTPLNISSPVCSDQGSQH